MSKTQEEIQRVLELDAAATPGPWREMATGRETYIDAPESRDESGIYVVAYADATDYQTAVNFGTAAAYRTLAPLLARKLERAMEVLEGIWSGTYDPSDLVQYIGEIEAME